MKKIILSLFTLSLAASAIAEGTLDDELVLEDIGETLESVDLELEQMSTPDIPAAVLPDIFTPSEVTESEIEDTESTEEPPLPENVIVNIVEVTEKFYKLELNTETNIYSRIETLEAKPGDLIELVITAVNTSAETVTDVEMTNTVPSGPVTLINGSFATDLKNSLFRVSRNGKDFFPSDAGIEASTIQFIQWVIFSLDPSASIEFRYRISVNK